MEPSEHTLRVLRKSVAMYELSGGAFDVTYAPLRSLWRRAQREGRMPDRAALERALVAVGSGKLVFEDGGVQFAVEGMEVDLGGIAKGYAIDLAAEALRQAGARAGIVDIGGDLRLFGLPEPGGRWRISVRRPPGVERDWVLAVGPCAVATSGEYARGFRIGDRWLSHIVDPRTGRSVERMLSATVVAADAMSADALATAVSVLGEEEGGALVDSLPGVECMIMIGRPDGGVRTQMSAGFAELVEGP
ncbi:MAG: FAD:protein FMN transferase [Planctomycetota bacterium]